MTAEQYAPGVLMTPKYWWDEYVGTADDIVAAGLVRPHELPGVGGNGRCMMTFNPDGSRVSRGCSRSSDKEGYRQIRKAGDRITVLRWVSQTEGEARVRKLHRDRNSRAQEAEELASAWPFPICLGAPC